MDGQQQERRPPGAPKLPDHEEDPGGRQQEDEVGETQRGEVRIALRYEKFFWIEDVIRMVETSASAEVFALLKRNDEKLLTETAYHNPMFVVDVVREIAQKLSRDPNITWFTVGAETFESIHNHSAYAFIERPKKGV